MGFTVPGIQIWKKRTTVTARQVAGLVDTASKQAATHFGASVVRPLVEFYPITACDSKHGARVELFDSKDERGTQHPFRHGLRTELDAKHGVYIFFDSRGQAIYAGKARKQSLWREMNLAFNRERGELQTVKRVKHPVRKQEYKTSDEKARQIVDYAVPLYEIAHYFSAYEVTQSLVEDVEALLVRSFANNLLNKRMERFGGRPSTRR